MGWVPPMRGHCFVGGCGDTQPTLMSIVLYGAIAALHLSCMDIREWLITPNPPYETGLQLFKQYGGSSVVFGILQKGGPTFYNRGRLMKELVELKEKLKAEPSPSERIKTHTPIDTEKTTWRKAEDINAYPEVLHPAYTRMQELYALINHLHPQLDRLYLTHQGECFDSVQKILKAWKEIDEIYTLLHYYDDHKQVLPNRYTKTEKDLPYDRDAIKQRQLNLRTYISRSKGKPSKYEKVREWEAELKKLDAML